jgi:hypothetical protein
MSTFVGNKVPSKNRPRTDVLVLFPKPSPESAGRPGCEHISIRRNPDDADNVIGGTRWATRGQYDDYLGRRTDTLVVLPVGF